MEKLSGNQIGGLIRAVMAVLAGFMVGHFGITEGVWLELTGGIVAVAVALWSIYSNTVLAQTTDIAKSPDIVKVIAEPALAIKVPSAKVVADDPEANIGLS